MKRLLAFLCLCAFGAAVMVQAKEWLGRTALPDFDQGLILGWACAWLSVLCVWLTSPSKR